MKLKFTTIVLVAAIAGAAAPALARHAVQQAAPQIVNLKDGSTLYVFTNGKMAREDKFGRAVLLKGGEILEAVDGRKVAAVGNEVARLDRLLSEEHLN